MRSGAMQNPSLTIVLEGENGARGLFFLWLLFLQEDLAGAPAVVLVFQLGTLCLFY